eukprot:sb/3468613/
MATMEDRLLGEKLHYYCSSSEDEGDDKEEEEKETQQEDDEGGFDREKSKEAQAEKIADQQWKGVSIGGKIAGQLEWKGASFWKVMPIVVGGNRRHNTGVKGVKEDARAYQRWILEKEQKRIDDLAKAASRFSLQESDKGTSSDLEHVITPPPIEPDKGGELSDLEDDGDDEFMAAYRQKRMQEMKEIVSPVFGVVTELTENTFCETIDAAAPYTDVVVYIHESHIAACRRLVGSGGVGEVVVYIHESHIAACRR